MPRSRTCRRPWSFVGTTTRHRGSLPSIPRRRPRNTIAGLKGRDGDRRPVKCLVLGQFQLFRQATVRSRHRAAACACRLSDLAFPLRGRASSAGSASSFGRRHPDPLRRQDCAAQGILASGDDGRGVAAAVRPAGSVGAGRPDRSDDVCLCAGGESARRGVRRGGALSRRGVVLPNCGEFYRDSDVFLCPFGARGIWPPYLRGNAERASRGGIALDRPSARFLAHHPLALRRMDYDEAAELVLAATDPFLRDAVVRWQNDNLTSFYTTAIVAGQLEAGATGAPCDGAMAWRSGSRNCGCCRAVLREPATGRFIPISSKYRAPALWTRSTATSPGTDVEAYGALAAAVPRRKRGPIKRGRAGGRAFREADPADRCAGPAARR